ncbi:hypothetical protein PYW07_001492 [Mythimna separata]|uniref:Spaetzle domain-containing protein n=1 Tax=Mythimna separata TaxID=271217 RepID=A0AAD7YU06_MYTSE|nr:hypothetical protein PYW07_001492 [Mythimna separata]
MESWRITLLFTFMILVANVPDAQAESSAEEFGLEIPEQCSSLSICDNIPNYPQQQAKKAVARLRDKGILSDETPKDTRRGGRIEDNIELCAMDVKTFIPEASVDAQGKWHVVLNPKGNPIQKFQVEMCKREKSPCAAFVVFAPGKKGACIQNYVYNPMRVLHTDGSTSNKLLRLPSTCSCVAQPAG